MLCISALCIGILCCGLCIDVLTHVQCVPMTWFDFEMLHIVFLGLSVLMWTSLYCSCKFDPGFVPQNIPEYDEALRQVVFIDDAICAVYMPLIYI